MVRGVETVWTWMRMVFLQNFTTAMAMNTKTRIYFRSPGAFQACAHRTDDWVVSLGSSSPFGRHRSEDRTDRSDGIMGKLQIGRPC